MATSSIVIIFLVVVLVFTIRNNKKQRTNFRRTSVRKIEPCDQYVTWNLQMKEVETDPFHDSMGLLQERATILHMINNLGGRCIFIAPTKKSLVSKDEVIINSMENGVDYEIFYSERADEFYFKSKNKIQTNNESLPPIEAGKIRQMINS